MEPYQVTQTSKSELHIEGLPDAVKLVSLDEPTARRVGDLALHRSDLNFALGCLETLDKLPEDQEVTSTALWRSAIVHYFKCFGDTGKRFQLDAKAVYKDRPPEALLAFEFFKGMRNKHIVHDENAYMQSAVGAAINDGTKGFKVEQIVALVHTFDVLNDNNRKNLRLLVQHAIDWTTIQFEECTARIARDLERLTYGELASRPTVQVKVPSVEDAMKPRRG